MKTQPGAFAGSEPTSDASAERGDAPNTSPVVRPQPACTSARSGGGGAGRQGEGPGGTPPTHPAAGGKGPRETLLNDSSLGGQGKGS